jgi:hypothetical protein
MSTFPKCQKLNNNAATTYNQGRHREAATTYLQAFRAAPSKWTEKRWQVFRGYTSILQENPIESDVDALSQITVDHSEVKLFRCYAALTLGLLLWGASGREGAAEKYCVCIRLGEKVKGKDRMGKISTEIPASWVRV